MDNPIHILAKYIFSELDGFQNNKLNFSGFKIFTIITGIQFSIDCLQ